MQGIPGLGGGERRGLPTSDMVFSSLAFSRWTAQDVRLLRVSVLSFLEQLSLVVQTMQRFGPPVSR